MFLGQPSADNTHSQDIRKLYIQFKIPLRDETNGPKWNSQSPLRLIRLPMILGD